MEKKKRTSLQIFLGFLVAFLIVLVIGLAVGIWLYSGSATPAKLSVFKAVHLPLGTVGGVHIAPGDLALYDRVGPLMKKTSTTALTDALKLEVVAKNKVKVSTSDIAAAAESLEKDEIYAKAVSLAGKNNAEGTLAKSFATDAKLKAWYASQPDLEPALASRLFAVQSALANGSTYDQVAKQYSDDSATKWFAGDTGYVDLDKAIPEYRDAVQNLPKNKPTVVYTRYGIHLVEVVGDTTDNGKRLVNIHEVVLVPKGYEAWLAQEKDKVPVVWYIN